jgi:hypothetical protein
MFFLQRWHCLRGILDSDPHKKCQLYNIHSCKVLVQSCPLSQVENYWDGGHLGFWSVWEMSTLQGQSSDHSIHLQIAFFLQRWHCLRGSEIEDCHLRSFQYRIIKYVKMNKSFFLETINMIEHKLYMNGNWMMPSNADIFSWIRNPKWATTTGLSFQQ